MSFEKTIVTESKSNQMDKMEPRLTEQVKMEAVPVMQADLNIPVSNQTSVMIPSSQHHVGESNSYFPKTMEVSNVLQACQNYDFRYQTEILKTGVALSINHRDDYCEQVMRDDAEFRLACAKYLKNYQSNHYSQMPKKQCRRETEEQATMRRARRAQRMRNYRQSLRALETEQEAAERRAQHALRMKNYREFRRELKPKAAAEHRAKHAERMRNYRRIKRELEPEKAAYHRIKNALRMRNYRRNKRLQDSITKVD